MRVIAFGLAAVFISGAAQAASCDYRNTVLIVDRPVEVHECWDLSKWPADKAQSFCTSVLSGQGQVQLVSACPAKSVAQCAGAKFAAPAATSMPPEYFAKMPKEIADKIKANVNQAGAALTQYNGLETTVRYYAGGPGSPTIEDQRQDCVSGKKGSFGQ